MENKAKKTRCEGRSACPRSLGMPDQRFFFIIRPLPKLGRGMGKRKIIDFEKAITGVAVPKIENPLSSLAEEGQ